MSRPLIKTGINNFYKDQVSGIFYFRKMVDGKSIHKSLKTRNILEARKIAKQEYDKWQKEMSLNKRHYNFKHGKQSNLSILNCHASKRRCEAAWDFIAEVSKETGLDLFNTDD